MFASVYTCEHVFACKRVQGVRCFLMFPMTDSDSATELRATRVLNVSGLLVSGEEPSGTATNLNLVPPLCHYQRRQLGTARYGGGEYSLK